MQVQHRYRLLFLVEVSVQLAENTRAAHPIEYIPNAKLPCVGPHPKNVILLACDAFGVLPPGSKLNLTQTMYHFIIGYTALAYAQASLLFGRAPSKYLNIKTFFLKVFFYALLDETFSI
ncbi:phosphoenolpyruvate carboxykinase (ATP) 1-like isoform X2 [Vicia villosa]|uniref:phosphoenolpyruvate carboxykinase (ATP) 1-like isoform X2 n=1 Tax=Vicia villosa TaxID=3911 RepID=UPI00273CB7B0|nr:phosphoenolpyruvate carboxykinase (ATP) 1-like isoform X2 [Vicia villosa]